VLRTAMGWACPVDDRGHGSSWHRSVAETVHGALEIFNSSLREF
jgi:hypothetical protein